MRRSIISVLTILFTLFIASVAQAQTVVAGESTQGETLLGRSIISGYYAIYSNDNGTTYKAEETPGQPIPVTLGQSKSIQQSFGAPVNISGVQLTRIVIKGPDEVTDGFFEKNGVNHIWNSNITTKDLFNIYYKQHIPVGFNLNGTGDLATGKVDVKWGFKLNNILQAPSNIAQDITSNSGLGDFYVDTWSSSPFAKASKAWLWTLPVVVEWYGIQQTPPDLSTKLEADKFDNVKPGQKLTSTVTYSLNKDHPKAEKAWIRLHHFVGSNEYPLTLEPVNPGDAPDANGYVTLQPGESKTYKYTFTVQNTPSKIVARINPVDTDQDKDWSNNRDEAPVIIPAYDIKVGITPDKSTYQSFSNTVGVGCTITVTRKDWITGDIPAKLTVTGGPGMVKDLTLAPGQSKTFKYSFGAAPGTYTIKAQAWPSGVSDAYSPDNVAQTTIKVVKRSLPKGEPIRVGL